MKKVDFIVSDMITIMDDIGHTLWSIERETNEEAIRNRKDYLHDICQDVIDTMLDIKKWLE